MLRRRLLVPGSVDGPLVNGLIPVILGREITTAAHEMPQQLSTDVVEDTEETKQAHERSDTLFLLATLSMLHSGNIRPYRAT